MAEVDAAIYCPHKSSRAHSSALTVTRCWVHSVSMAAARDTLSAAALPTDLLAHTDWRTHSYTAACFACAVYRTVDAPEIHESSIFSQDILKYSLDTLNCGKSNAHVTNLVILIWCG